MSMNQSNLIDGFIKGKTRGTASHMFIDGNVLYSYGHHFPLLVRRGFGFLMNADKHSVTTSSHQSACARHAKVLIPFSILSRLGLYYDTVEIIDQNKERWDTNYRIDPKTKEKIEYQERRPAGVIITDPEHTKYYLASMDNNNYFASELPHPVNTVQEGLDTLKPVEAVGEEGKDYLRQGEWFFIPVDGVKALKSSIKNGREKEIRTRRAYGPTCKIVDQEYTVVLPVEFLVNRNKQQTPHHYATEYGFNLGYPLLVRGTVRHTNRDHRMLKLGNGKQWYMAIESNHVLSVGVGRVD